MSNYLEELDKFPEKKISFSELEMQLQESENMTPEQKKNMEFEKLSLAFSTDHNTEIYYGPKISGKREDGTDFEFPNKSMISKEALDYWRDRAQKTANPLLKLRYLGLQIEFRSVIGERALGQERFYYITAIITAVDNDLFKYPYEGFMHLNRALKIAIYTKQNIYIEKVKTAYFNYDAKYSTDDTPGLYSQIVNAIKEHPKIFTDDERSRIVENVNDRYHRLYNSDNYSNLKDCAEVLVDYYGVKDRENSLNILRQLEAKTMSMNDVLGPMRTQIFLHSINQRYFTLSSKDDQERISVEIAKIGPEVVNSLKPIEIPMGEDVIQLIKESNEELTTGTSHERLLKFVGSFWHHKNEDKSNAAQQKANSILGFVTTITYDQADRPTTMGQTAEDNDKDAVEFFRTFAPMMARVHHTSLLKNIEDNVLDKETSMGLIQQCPAFAPQNLPFIEKALDAYYTEDYIQFMHLAIPQIEGACRNFVAIRGESTYSCKNISGGYSYITFEGVLRKQCIMDIRNGDFAYHLMAVFTDNHGLNLRNEIMHGMAPTSYFSFPYADIVFHSLILTAIMLT
ncbi:DUF4209 domain-containing protein [Duncaniella dubosii]|uniref:DUF4209 domain-containing protein n=1 Tax=Duncaniella dubosii TaxID=2518971 RepID=UPI0032B28D3D